MKWLFRGQFYDDRTITNKILCHPETVTALDVMLGDRIDRHPQTTATIDNGLYSNTFRRKVCRYCTRVQLDRSKATCDGCGAPL